MTSKRLPPEAEREIELLKRRLSKLEARLTNLADALRPEKVFTVSGPLYETTTPRYQTRSTLYAVEVIGLLTVPVTAEAEVAVKRNDDVVATLFFPPGMTRISLPIGEFYSPSDDLTVEIVEAGSDDEDLDVIVRFR